MTRGCGELAHDALYMHWRLGEKGIPIKQLTLCPVWKLDREKLGISYQGLTYLPQMDWDGKPVLDENGTQVFDVYDVVGRKHYPYKTDFYEEGKRMGFNRRWPTSADPSVLHPGLSQYYLCTDAGAIKEPDLSEIARNIYSMCPEDHACYKYMHVLPFEPDIDYTCTMMWHHELPESACEYDPAANLWWRKTPSCQYPVHLPPKKAPEWEFGAFMVMPLGMFVGTTPRASDSLSDRVQKVVDTVTGMGMKTRTVQLDEGLEQEDV